MAPRREERFTIVVGGLVVLALILVSALLWLLRSREQPPASNAAVRAESKSDKKNGSPSAQKFRGKKAFEPSGVAWVNGTDQVLIVDDNDPSHVSAVTIDQNTDVQGEITAVDLGVHVEDPEDITTDGTYFYVVGSQFRKKSGKSAGLVRFKYDATTKQASEVTSISGLAETLVAGVPELASTPAIARSPDSINIEGLGWDATGDRLLLGFRNPLVTGKALIVPVSFKDPTVGLVDGNLMFQPSMTVDLAGQGIRCIQQVATGKFLVISGEAEGEKAAGFGLWSWDGSNAPTKISDLDDKIKPEGVTLIEINGSRSLFVVGDAGYHVRLEAPG